MAEFQMNVDGDQTRSHTYLTPLLIQSLTLYKWTFGRFPSFLISVKLEHRHDDDTLVVRVPLQKTSTGALPSFLVALIILVSAVLYIGFFVCSSMGLIFRRTNMIQMMCALCWITLTTTMIALCYQTLYIERHSAKTFDHFMSNGFRFRFPPSSTIPVRDTGGFLIFYLLVGSLLFAPFLPFICRFYDYDPGYAILGYLFVGDPHYYSIGSIVILNLISLIWIMLVIYVLIRLLCIFLIILIVGLRYTEAYLATIQSMVNVDDEVFRFFIHLRIHYTIGRRCFGQISLILVIFGVWFLTEFAWFGINCLSLFPAFLTLIVLAAFFGGLGLSVFLFYVAATVRINSEKLVWSKCIQYHGSEGLGKRDVRRWRLRQWRAQPPLPIYCGDHCLFCRDSVMIFLDMLVSSITNAVVLIQV